MPLPDLTLVLGAAASGKSAFAEELVLQSALRPVYIATAQAFDAEMTAKIAAHRDSRGGAWRTIEEPMDLAHALGQITPGDAVLVDCVTLWLTNLILAETDLDAAQAALFSALTGCPAPIVIVSNEVGAGIVPDNALARRFRNAQGRLNQSLAAQADRVITVMAGLPLVLKGQI